MLTYHVTTLLPVCLLFLSPITLARDSITPQVFNTEVSKYPTAEFTLTLLRNV